MENKEYETKRYQAVISVEDYLKDYVDVPVFLECCKQCGNYGRLWSCPPYDFDVEEYWRRYKNLLILGTKISFTEETLQKELDAEAEELLLARVLGREKNALAEQLFSMEQKKPGSISLSAGSCSLCAADGCRRLQSEPCVYSEQMRYSIESLGGNVGKTVSDLLGIRLQWITEGRLPDYFVLVSGLLY